MENIEIWNRENRKHPFIISIPHSGMYLPKKMKENLKDNVVLANMDWYLPKLYSFLQELEITTIVNNVSRYVIDPNREVINSKNQSYLKEYIYTKTTFNNEIYKEPLKDEEINNRIQKYYNPYHKAIDELITDKLTRFDRVYLVDLHSFGKELKEDIVLGNRNGQTASHEYMGEIKKCLGRLRFYSCFK